MRALALLLAFSACAATAPPSPVPRVASEPKPPSLEPILDPRCERVAFPAIHAVVSIDADLVARAMAPVVRAVCACTRPGDRVRVVATLEPNRGAVTAHVADDAGRDECVQHTIIGRYPPFPLESDCIGCGSRAATLRFPIDFLHAK